MENNRNFIQGLSDQIEYLKNEVKRRDELLKLYGYPENRPLPKADAGYWKEKYKRLMDEKIKIERERNKLFECSDKLLRTLQAAGIEVNLKDYVGIYSQAGIPLVPGSGNISNLGYDQFGNVF